MMFTATRHEEAAWAIRYPRGQATGMEYRKEFRRMEIGKGVCLREGEEVAVLSFGPIGKYVTQAAERLEEEGISIGHYDMRFAKPLDEALIDSLLERYECLITLEDGTRIGGFGSAVAEYVCSRPERVPVIIMGLPDRVIEHGTQLQLHDEAGIGPDGVVTQVKKAMGIGQKA